MSSEAFVTLATDDDNALGALVLAQSIRRVGTKRNLVVLISNHLSNSIRKSLDEVFNEVVDLHRLQSLVHPELAITFKKLNCWLLTQYSKCVFLNSDCLVLRSIDNLFEREEFSAAPNAGWPDRFNSGVFVYRPSTKTFNDLMLHVSQHQASFDGSDQDLLNSFFSRWRTEDISRHLPFTYNVTADALHSYLPVVTRSRDNIHVVHFAGELKPWQLTYKPRDEELLGIFNARLNIEKDFLLVWWKIVYEKIWPVMKQQKVNNEYRTDDLVNSPSSEQFKSHLEVLRQVFETTLIDYLSRESFGNTERQLHRNVEQRSYLREILSRKIPANQKTTTVSNETQFPPTTSVVGSSTSRTTTNNAGLGIQSEIKSEAFLLIIAEARTLQFQPSFTAVIYMTTVGEFEKREIMRARVDQLPCVIEITNKEINEKFEKQKTQKSDEILFHIHVHLIDPNDRSLYMISTDGKPINSNNYTATNMIYLQRP